MEKERKKLNDILEKAIIFSLQKIKENLMGNEFKPLDELRLKSFIRLYNDNVAPFDSLDKKILNEVDKKLEILKLNESTKKYEIQTIGMKENFDELWDYYRLTNRNLISNNHNEIPKEDYNEKIETKITEEIIIDKFWLNILPQYMIEEIRCVNHKSEIFIVKSSKENEINKLTIKCDNQTKNILIKSMAVSPKISRSLIRWQRQSIPAFEGYGELITKEMRYGIQNSFFYFSNINLPRIIAPFTIDDIKDIKNISCDIFIERIISQDSFKKLLVYVKDKNINDKITEKEITDKYIEIIKEYYNLINNEN